MSRTRKGSDGRKQRWLLALVGGATLGLSMSSTAPAHETDQFTLPLGREFADLKGEITQWFYDHMASGMAKTNAKIRQCVSAGRNPEKLADLQSAYEIVSTINWEFPAAYNTIEGFENRTKLSATQARYPGLVVGYKEQITNILQHTHFVLDPRQFFRIWLATTIKFNGVYMGTDKIGHFTDMGMNYYRPYSAALKKGLSKEEAIKKGVSMGTEGLIFSEKGAVGNLSAGDYSNGDLAANYLGFKFYINLTEPTMLAGKMQPPMLVRDGDCWAFAPHVRPDSDFMTPYFTDHMNEALNPGLFEPAMRNAVRTAVEERTERVLQRYLDSNGNRRPKTWFDQMTQSLFTYYGEDYGHGGSTTELITIGNTCYANYDYKGSIIARNPLGLTALHDAAERCDVEQMRKLIQSGADVNSPVRSHETYSPEWGNTPLFYAARGGHKAAVELLLEKGASISATNDRGATPLHWAIHSPAMVDVLLKRDAKVDARDNLNRTPLHWAASEGFADSCEVLLAAGADVNPKDKYGESPLTRAVRWQRIDAVKMLASKRGDVNSPSDFSTTPLHAAAAGQDPEMVELLVDHGANVNAQDDFGWAPLHVAARNGSPTVVKSLLEHRAKASIAASNDITPLHLAARRGREEVVAMLIDDGANVNAVSNLGITPLHEAAFADSPSVISELLRHRANAIAKNRMGFSPLDVALTGNKRDAVVVLRKAVQQVSLTAHP